MVLGYRFEFDFNFNACNILCFNARVFQNLKEIDFSSFHVTCISLWMFYTEINIPETLI